MEGGKDWTSNHSEEGDNSVPWEYLDSNELLHGQLVEGTRNSHRSREGQERINDQWRKREQPKKKEQKNYSHSHRDRHHAHSST